MMKRILLGFMVAVVATAAQALEVGGKLPSVAIAEEGELILKGDKIHYQDWASSTITTDSPALIFYLAGRMSSETIIAPLRTALDEADYPDGAFQSISIVNMDDALWGTGGLILSELGDNKREHPRAQIIADSKGVGLKSWSLKGKSVAVILLNKHGDIEHFQQGEITATDVENIMTMLDREIAASAP